MTQEDIIRMARQAGAWPELSETPTKDVAFLKRFAALVAAAEREATAKFFDGKVGRADLRDIAAAIRARGQA
jgi:hypothetical protein